MRLSNVMERLSVIAVRFSNPDRSPPRIQSCDTGPTPTGFAEIISDDFPVLHARRIAPCFCSTNRSQTATQIRILFGDDASDFSSPTWIRIKRFDSMAEKRKILASLITGCMTPAQPSMLPVTNKPVTWASPIPGTQVGFPYTPTSSPTDPGTALNPIRVNVIPPPSQTGNLAPCPAGGIKAVLSHGRLIASNAAIVHLCAYFFHAAQHGH